MKAMDALKKQASKLREQVAKQQQFGGTGYESSDVMVIDEVEMHRHQQLEKLYRSTRSGKEFQKDVVRAAETFTAIGHKHIEAGTKLSEDCYRYGTENANDNILAKAAAIYGEARKQVEKEQEDLNGLLSSQVLDPLRAMITGAPLEDARLFGQIMDIETIRERLVVIADEIEVIENKDQEVSRSLLHYVRSCEGASAADRAMIVERIKEIKDCMVDLQESRQVLVAEEQDLLRKVLKCIGQEN